ncbi:MULTISPECIES: response regulator [Thermoanaerobacter]|uniref:Stage 0 sporulation protein A homolog n=3 Tax=Thermoanaerobacter TaxID=1754 RepID=I8R410_9THEO|nr:MULTISPECIES: response regulator [Thermoanaerobacter]EGD51210.1 two component transcriptional regulator, winged helix family [Thermoanaerobacter ethanolicus JW 200]EIW00155.1 LOW QUALITY PROTEIN: response regulator with CheY-like receiver domain and winged-helix DNA-binding domain [Thermoanaerobacter siderophilus SR4]SFE49738.1 two-component system, OmpR family, response regulator VicR [Thermoanaerobacter thermohydrosulfuricus]HHY80667.1 response regulator transcription factor [Thermoanaerob
MSYRILIVDDEKPIVEIIKYNLEKEGYITYEAYDGEEALKIAKEQNPDLIILDVMLPKLDGFSVLRTLRQSMTIPILMLTAKEEEVDKVLGLELGADDYITKPFSIRELIARVKANLRRISLNGNESGNIIYVKNLKIDMSKYKVEKNNKEIELTSREFELLRFLILNKGLIFSREMLLEKVWGYEYLGDIRTVDVTIRRLREKIEDDPSNPKLIHTKRGVGYYFSDEKQI